MFNGSTGGCQGLVHFATFSQHFPKLYHTLPHFWHFHKFSHTLPHFPALPNSLPTHCHIFPHSDPLAHLDPAVLGTKWGREIAGETMWCRWNEWRRCRLRGVGDVLCVRQTYIYISLNRQSGWKHTVSLKDVTYL